jgi:hypothetical protein
MSTLDTFAGFEDLSQASNAESYRQFQQRMQAAAAQIQAIRASEQKQKKKEDQLIKILLKFIQSSQHGTSEDQIIELVSKLLGKNLPAAFILSLILLAYPDIQQESGLLLPSSAEQTSSSALANQNEQNPSTILPDLYLQKTLPLKLKIDIQAWIGELFNQTQENQQKLRLHALTPSAEFLPEIPALAFQILQNYLHSAGIFQEPQSSQAFLGLVFKNLAKELQQKQLKNKDLP